jgi:hypothetical protein
VRPVRGAFGRRGRSDHLRFQSGEVFALFGVRIAIAIVAEISAIALFGELRTYRPQLRILSWVRKNRRGSV